MFCISCLFAFPFRLLLSLPGKLSVSPLHTRELLSSHCIYNPVAPSRPSPRCDWLANADEPAQYAAFPILFTFPSGNQISHSQKNLSTYLWADYTCEHNYAGWCTHSLTNSREKGEAFRNATLFSFALFKSLSTKIYNIWCCTNIHDFYTHFVQINKVESTLSINSEPAGRCTQDNLSSNLYHWSFCHSMYKNHYSKTNAAVCVCVCVWFCGDVWKQKNELSLMWLKIIWVIFLLLLLCLLYIFTSVTVPRISLTYTLITCSRKSAMRTCDTMSAEMCYISAWIDFLVDSETWNEGL